MTGAVALSAEEERLRPLYARVLRLRHVDPGGVLCFVYFEGMVSLGLLLALAELVRWWEVLLLPACVAGMVKANDLVAAAVARSAARVPAQERDRFRRELQPVIGRASVPRASLVDPALHARTDALTRGAAPVAASPPAASGTVPPAASPAASGAVPPAALGAASPTNPASIPPAGPVSVPPVSPARAVPVGPARAVVPAPATTRADVSSGSAVPVPGQAGVPVPVAGVVPVRPGGVGGVVRRSAGSGRWTVGSGRGTGSGRRFAWSGWSGGLGSGVREIGGRLVARLVPAGRPLSMTAMVRARLEAGARPWPEPEQEPRPDLGLAERLRGGAPGPSPLTVSRMASGLPVWRHPSLRSAARAAAAPKATDSGVGWPDTVEPPRRQIGADPASTAARPRNDRRVERPARRWTVRPVDSARQSAVRRYE